MDDFDWRYAMRVIALSILFGWLSCPVLAFEVSGLSTPESVIVDPETGNYFISNINGDPTEKDNNGFIAKLDTTGKITALKFIAGGQDEVMLHAPKGLALVGPVLYVSDIDTVRGFDKETGKMLFQVDVKEARFLNDITADLAGNLYVSDTTIFTDPSAPGTIFKIETKNQHRVRIFSRDVKLGSPNGLAIHPKSGRLMANTWGTGRVVELGQDGKVKSFIEDTDWRDLDGLDYDGNENLYLSNFTDGTIYKVSPNQTVSIIKEGLTTPADISLDRKRKMILVPSFSGNKVFTIGIGR